MEKEILGLHDDRCLIWQGKWCNCPSAAFLREGVGCGNPGCLSHATHRCEKCGRIAGRNEH